ncbi:MAG: hypothetical protein ABSA54_14970 [Terriglobales bacterium]
MTSLVIGTSHEYQRHQDRSAERERIRERLENIIRKAICESHVDLIAEEAGSKEQVHAQLKADEAKTAAFDVLFAETKAVDEPQDTIARLVADASGVRYVDIRPPSANPLPKDADNGAIAKRDEEMVAMLLEPLRLATSVLVICGARHRDGLARHLEQRGIRVERQRFPENLEVHEP